MIFVYNPCSASRKCQYLTTRFERCDGAQVRVLRDSTSRFVRPSVRPSVGLSVRPSVRHTVLFVLFLRFLASLLLPK